MKLLFGFIVATLTTCSLWSMESTNQFSQIRCISRKIKPGCLEEVKAYYQSAMKERRKAVLETFANEGMLIETGFIKEDNGSYYLIFFSKARDMELALAAFRASTLDEDSSHKDFMEKCFEPREVLSPVYYLEAEDSSDPTKQPL